jgi:hypothetical protein
MNRVTGKTFTNARVVLDDGTLFSKCQFDKCELVITGASPLRLDQCHVADSCLIGFDDHAAQVLETLSGLYHALGPTIERVLQTIREGPDGLHWVK